MLIYRLRKNNLETAEVTSIAWFKRRKETLIRAATGQGLAALSIWISVTLGALDALHKTQEMWGYQGDLGCRCASEMPALSKNKPTIGQDETKRAHS